MVPIAMVRARRTTPPATVMADPEPPAYLQGWRTASMIPDYTKLYYQHGEDLACQALIVKAVSSGFMVCLPLGGVPEEEAASSDHYGGIWGLGRMPR